MSHVLGTGAQYGSYSNNSTSFKDKSSGSSYEAHNSNYFSFNKPNN